MLNQILKQMKCYEIVGTLACGSLLLLTSSGVVKARGAAADDLQAFEKLFGVTEGKRRNHTKGFCFTATLSPNDPAIKDHSNSELFSAESKVIGRLSHKGGKSAPSDAKAGLYGMSLAITTASGEQNLMALNTEDFFPVATPEAFIELLKAKAAGKEAVKAFEKSSPELQRYSAHMAKRSKELKPYEGQTYNGVSSFYLVDAEDNKTAAKWSFIPATEQSINLEPDQDFFYENLQNNLNKGDVIWNMVITIANEGDDVNNPSVQWTGEHKTISAAKLKISAISTEDKGQCDKINYDPMILSAGIEPSDDPLFQARRDIYALGFGKRLSEK